MQQGIIGYSERGLINLLVNQLIKEDQLVKEFLKGVTFNKENTALFTERNNENFIYERVTFFVEPNFAQFGSPDLIVLLEDKDENKHVLIIEAKLFQYEFHASSGDMTMYGFNSKINGQLAMRHRLILALKRFTFNEEILTEDHKVGNWYNQELKDTFKGGRKLKKKIIIDKVISRICNAKDYSLIMITGDENHPLGRHKKINNTILPKFYQDDQSVGWIGWEYIKQILKNSSEYFDTTWDLSGVEHKPKNYFRDKLAQNKKPKWNPEILKNKILGIFNQLKMEAKVEIYKASISFKSNSGKTVGKILLDEDNKLFIGIEDYEGDQIKKPYFTWQFKNRAFHCYNIGTINNIDEELTLKIFRKYLDVIEL